MILLPATAVIDCQQWLDNLFAIKKMVPNNIIMAIAKADAYGHGIIEYAKTVEPHIDVYGVAREEEAFLLRSAGILKPIVLLEGFFTTNRLQHFADHNIETVIHTQEQLEAIIKSKLIKPIKVWLKIDTGMHRLGIDPEEFKYYYKELSNSENVLGEVNFISHFSKADIPDDSYTENQLTTFLNLVSNQLGLKSIAASSGILFWQNSHLDMVRPGIIMHGISPNDDSITKYNLNPVMTLTTSLISIRNLKAHQPVGYGGTWISKQPTKIGVVAIGYGDGYPRDAKAGTPVYINGRIVPVVGRVSMDMLTVDLGIESQDNIGDTIILWGKQLPIEQVAKAMNVLSYELVTKLTKRVNRKYINTNFTN